MNTENKRFTVTQDFEEHHRQIRDNGQIIMGCFIESQAEVIVNLLNELNEENNELREIINDIFNSLLETDFAKNGYCNALLRIIGEENDVEKTKQRIKEYIYD